MAKAGNKAGKGKSRKPAAKKSPPKKRAASPKRTSSAPRKGGYEITCSECYSDFNFHPDSKAPKIHCPECMHTGNVSGNEVMSKIAIAKGQERSSLVKAVVPALMFLACGLGWIYMLTGAGVGETPMIADGVNYGFLGAGAVLFIVTLAMIFKYEGNRTEVYF